MKRLYILLILLACAVGFAFYVQGCRSANFRKHQFEAFAAQVAEARNNLPHSAAKKSKAPVLDNADTVLAQSNASHSPALPWKLPHHLQSHTPRKLAISKRGEVFLPFEAAF